jgi:hypothetical protein
MKLEWSARVEAASANKQALRSQISRIRETYDRMLHIDTTLAERIRTLFREQGVTLTAVLTAVGMTISTLTLTLKLFLTGVGGGASPPAPPPADKPGVKAWVKKQLQNLGSALVKLAGMAVAALPGLIGSIVSWLLKLIAQTVGWVAGNIWVLLVGVAGLLIYTVRDMLAKK